MRKWISIVLLAPPLVFGAAVAKKGTTAKKSNARKSSARNATAKKGKARPRGQMQPAPERYREIQQALATKGYYKGDVNGAWGPDSQEALKRFQQDQNIEATGKLNSLSLIALGLGPRQTPKKP